MRASVVFAVVASAFFSCAAAAPVAEHGLLHFLHAVEARSNFHDVADTAGTASPSNTTTTAGSGNSNTVTPNDGNGNNVASGNSNSQGNGNNVTTGNGNGSGNNLSLGTINFK